MQKFSFWSAQIDNFEILTEIWNFNNFSAPFQSLARMARYFSPPFFLLGKMARFKISREMIISSEGALHLKIRGSKITQLQMSESHQIDEMRRSWVEQHSPKIQDLSSVQIVVILNAGSSNIVWRQDLSSVQIVETLNLGNPRINEKKSMI